MAHEAMNSGVPRTRTHTRGEPIRDGSALALPRERTLQRGNKLVSGLSMRGGDAIDSAHATNKPVMRPARCAIESQQ